MDENNALAIVFANTKRRKRAVDLLTIAECFDFLLKEYRSQEAVAEKTDLSREMVREFLQLINLPEFVKTRIRSREIDSIDTAYRLATIKDEETLRNVVNKLSGAQTHDFRDVLRSVQENENLSIEKAKELVLAGKPKDIHFFVIDFSDKHYKKLLTLANQKKSSPAEVIKEIVENWLNDKESDSESNE